MIKYILKRILLMIPVMLGIMLVIFAILEVAPGDAARNAAGEDATMEEVEEYREKLGLDRPFFTRYFDYVLGVCQGDFGESYRTGVPVLEDLAVRFPVTAKIAIFGILFSIILALPLGIISAVKQYSLPDTISTVITLVLTSMPGFWLGMMLSLVFALRLKWFPATGSDTWLHLVLPVATVGISAMSNLARMTRSTMLEVIRQDYIRTARAKGAKETSIVIKHALQNAMLPLVTVIGNNFAFQLGGTVMIESVFAINGVGSYLVQAVRMKDYPVVLGSLLVICFLASVVNLIVDITYTFIDPRVKTTYLKVKGGA